MNAAVKKLKKSSGETLVETLVSTLIIVTSVFMMMASFFAASRINLRIREVDAQYEREIAIAEAAAVQTEAGSVTLKDHLGGVLGSYTVMFHGGEQELRSYTLQAEGGAG